MQTEAAETLIAHKKFGLFYPSVSRPSIFVEGEDRKNFLQGIASQDILKQDEWSLSYSFFLNPKARILFDAWCGNFEDKIGLFPPAGTREEFINHLKKYLFFRTKAKITDMSEHFREIRLVGPETISVLLSLFDNNFSGSSFRMLKNGGYVLIHPTSFQHNLDVGLQADLFIPIDQFETTQKSLEDFTSKKGGVLLDESSYLAYLTEKGIPLFPSELNDSFFPAEAGLDSVGVSYNKGCYVGQEPVTRLKFQGHLNRSLAGFRLEGGPFPKMEFPVTLFNPKDGNEAGILTRTSFSDILGSGIGLGYIKRNFSENGTELLLPDAQVVRVHSLPFV